VHGEIKKFVVTFLVMRHFFIVRGAPRACADFCDPTAVSRIIHLPRLHRYSGIPFSYIWLFMSSTMHILRDGTV